MRGVVYAFTGHGTSGINSSDPIVQLIASWDEDEVRTWFHGHGFTSRKLGGLRGSDLLKLDKHVLRNRGMKNIDVMNQVLEAVHQLTGTR